MTKTQQSTQQQLLRDLQTLRASLILEARSYDVLCAALAGADTSFGNIAAAYRFAAWELSLIINKHEKS